MKKIISLLLGCGVLVSTIGGGGNTAPPPTESPPTKIYEIIIEETSPAKAVASTEKEHHPTESVPKETEPTATVPVTTAGPKYKIAKATVTNTSEEKVAPQFEETIVSITPQHTESTTTESVPLKEELKNETIKEPAPESETKPTEFDIHFWITFAKEYAVSVGLTLDGAAGDCWDNPISANSQCIYLERDIKSRLNCCAKDEDITDVWIWTEATGDDCYDIYIGYA